MSEFIKSANQVIRRSNFTDSLTANNLNRLRIFPKFSLCSDLRCSIVSDASALAFCLHFGRGSDDQSRKDGYYGYKYVRCVREVQPGSPSDLVISSSAETGGTISPSGFVSVAYGANQTFTITPDTGDNYKVAEVRVGGTPVTIPATGGTYSFTNVTANSSISASFNLRPPLTITASAEAGGTISPSGVVSVDYGADQTFDIKANTGYTIASILVDGVVAPMPEGPTGSYYPFRNVTTNRTISVKFALETFAITAIAYTGGTISPSGSVSVAYGANQTFTIIPDTDYTVSIVMVDGVAFTIPPEGGTHTFTNVTGNRTICATFTSSNNIPDARGYLEFSTIPSWLLMNEPLSEIVTITAKDGNGNRISGFNASVTLTNSLGIPVYPNPVPMIRISLYVVVFYFTLIFNKIAPITAPF